MQIVESNAALFAAGDDHVAQFGNVLADRVQLLDAVGLEQNRFGRAVVEPVLERVGTEQLRDWQRDRADAIESPCGRSRSRAVAAMHRDHVAAFDSQPRHRIGKPSAERANLAEGVGLDPALVVFIVERRFVAEFGMAIEAIDRDVVVGRNVPSMACAGVGDALRAVDGLLAKADDAHAGILHCAVMCGGRPGCFSALQ